MEAALLDDEGNPVPNGARNTWLTETALATALNMAFFAEQVSNFSLVAIALILAGMASGYLAFAALRWLPHTKRGDRARNGESKVVSSSWKGGRLESSPSALDG